MQFDRNGNPINTSDPVVAVKENVFETIQKSLQSQFFQQYRTDNPNTNLKSIFSSKATDLRDSEGTLQDQLSIYMDTPLQSYIGNEQEEKKKEEMDAVSKLIGSIIKATSRNLKKEKSFTSYNEVYANIDVILLRIFASQVDVSSEAATKMLELIENINKKDSYSHDATKLRVGAISELAQECLKMLAGEKSSAHIDTPPAYIMTEIVDTVTRVKNRLDEEYLALSNENMSTDRTKIVFGQIIANNKTGITVNDLLLRDANGDSPLHVAIKMRNDTAIEHMIGLANSLTDRTQKAKIFDAKNYLGQSLQDVNPSKKVDYETLVDHSSDQVVPIPKREDDITVLKDKIKTLIELLDEQVKKPIQDKYQTAARDSAIESILRDIRVSISEVCTKQMRLDVLGDRDILTVYNAAIAPLLSKPIPGTSALNISDMSGHTVGNKNISETLLAKWQSLIIPTQSEEESTHDFDKALNDMISASLWKKFHAADDTFLKGLGRVASVSKPQSRLNNISEAIQNLDPNSTEGNDKNRLTEALGGIQKIVKSSGNDAQLTKELVIAKTYFELRADAQKKPLIEILKSVYNQSGYSDGIISVLTFFDEEKLNKNFKDIYRKVYGKEPMQVLKVVGGAATLVDMNLSNITAPPLAVGENEPTKKDLITKLLAGNNAKIFSQSNYEIGERKQQVEEISTDDPVELHTTIYELANPNDKIQAIADFIKTTPNYKFTANDITPLSDLGITIEAGRSIDTIISIVDHKLSSTKVAPPPVPTTPPPVTTLAEFIKDTTNAGTWGNDLKAAIEVQFNSNYVITEEEKSKIKAIFRFGDRVNINTISDILGESITLNTPPPPPPPRSIGGGAATKNAPPPPPPPRSIGGGVSTESLGDYINSLENIPTIDRLVTKLKNIIVESFGNDYKLTQEDKNILAEKFNKSLFGENRYFDKVMSYKDFLEETLSPPKVDAALSNTSSVSATQETKPIAGPVDKGTERLVALENLLGQQNGTEKYEIAAATNKDEVKEALANIPDMAWKVRSMQESLNAIRSSIPTYFDYVTYKDGGRVPKEVGIGKKVVEDEKGNTTKHTLTSVLGGLFKNKPGDDPQSNLKPTNKDGGTNSNTPGKPPL